MFEMSHVGSWERVRLSLLPRSKWGEMRAGGARTTVPWWPTIRTDRGLYREQTAHAEVP